MPIDVTCPGCQTVYPVPEALAGKTIKCKGCGEMMEVVAVPEGAALSAAFMARMAAGLETGMGEGARWAKSSHTVEPDPAWVDAVGARYVRFRELVGG